MTSIKIIFVSLLVTVVTTMSAQTKEQMRTTMAVDIVTRILPAPMWDGIVCRDIQYDAKGRNIVMIVDTRRDHKPTNDTRNYSKWIVKNFLRAWYGESQSKKTHNGEGNPCLYLFVGKLLFQCVENNLGIVIFAQYDDGNGGDMSKFVLSSSELATAVLDAENSLCQKK